MVLVVLNWHGALICYTFNGVMSAEALGRDLLGESKEEGLDEVCGISKAILLKAFTSPLHTNMVIILIHFCSCFTHFESSKPLPRLP